MMREPGSKVIAVTSFSPGAGKSFVSSNLAVCFAIKGKRVLAIDGDLRHGTLSEFVGSPKPGLIDYLAGIVADVLPLFAGGLAFQPRRGIAASRSGSGGRAG